MAPTPTTQHFRRVNFRVETLTSLDRPDVRNDEGDPVRQMGRRTVRPSG